MFKEELQRVVDGTQGSLASLLMDFEGIAVEKYPKGSAASSTAPGFDDIEVVGAEVSVVLKAIQRATEMLDAGDTSEVAFKSEKVVTLVRVVNPEYFLALTMRPEGNLGKARYLLRLMAPKIRAGLEA